MGLYIGFAIPTIFFDWFRRDDLHLQTLHKKRSVVGGTLRYRNHYSFCCDACYRYRWRAILLNWLWLREFLQRWGFRRCKGFTVQAISILGRNWHNSQLTKQQFDVLFFVPLRKFESFNLGRSWRVSAQQVRENFGGSNNWTRSATIIWRKDQTCDNVWQPEENLLNFHRL